MKILLAAVAALSVAFLVAFKLRDRETPPPPAQGSWDPVDTTTT